MSKCPICDFELKELYHDIMWGWGTMELEKECAHCNLYNYRFSYGYSEENIGKIQWEWSYNETKEECDQRHKEQKSYIEQLKKEVAIKL